MKKIFLVSVLLMLVAICFAQTEVTIQEIQYTEDAGDGTYPSPYQDQAITTTGIVSGYHFSGEKFFITMPEGGAWKGIYVYDFSDAVSLGDQVEVTATVQEYYGLTELSDCTVTVVGSGTVPEPVSITTNELATSEAYEGVLVKISDVSVTEELNEYGEWYVDDGTGACQIDDGFFSLEDEGISVTAGDTWDEIIGIVNYSYEEYELHPRTAEDMNEEVSTNSKSWGRVKSLYK